MERIAERFYNGRKSDCKSLSENIIFHLQPKYYLQACVGNAHMNRIGEMVYNGRKNAIVNHSPKI